MWAGEHCTTEFVLWLGSRCESFNGGFHCTVELLLLCGFGDKSYSGLLFCKIKIKEFNFLKKTTLTVRFVAEPTQEA